MGDPFMIISDLRKRTAIATFYFAVGIGVVIASFWCAGRYARPSFLGAQVICFLASIFFGYLCFSAYKNRHKLAASSVAVIAGLIIFLMGAFPSFVGRAVFMRGFMRAVLAAAPLAAWQDLDARLSGVVDVLGRVPSEKLPEFVKQVFPGTYTYCAVATQKFGSTESLSSALISWKIVGCTVGVEIGQRLLLPDRVLFQQSLVTNVCIVAFRDE